MKRYCIKVVLLLLFYQSTNCSYKYAANSTLLLGVVSLFCLPSYGNKTFHTILHKSCILRQVKRRYNWYYHDMNKDTNNPYYVLRPRKYFKDKDYCDEDIDTIPKFLSKRHKCSLEEAYNIEYDKDDQEEFVKSFYYKNLAGPSVGVLIGSIGFGISFYNFCSNNYRL